MTSSVVLERPPYRVGPWSRMAPMQERDAARTRRLDRVFGDVLPDGTADDRPDQREEGADEGDRWLRDNRPPHHDGDA